MMHDDLLATLAEIAVTLAALSSVAGILTRRSERTPVEELEILEIRNVALTGMFAAAFALLPLTFRGSAVPLDGVLRLCSLAGAAIWLVVYALYLRRVVVPLRLREYPIHVFVIGLVLNLAGLSLLAWNAVAPGPQSAQRYVLALMCALALAGLVFINTVPRPR